MYGYEWTNQNGIYRLSVNGKIEKEIRPVFKEELDYFGFNEHWKYPDTKAPLLWAEGIRRYVLNGNCVAEAVGGGFYTKPTIKMFNENLELEPVDISALWKENERLILGLEKTATDFIRKTYIEYKRQGMTFAVAFSGGKDSLVLLDLVAKTLSPDKFAVVFSNTGMEFSTTLQSLERAKKYWSSLKFYEAASHLEPADSWEEFGPPGRRMRWCCAVHKSVPAILLLREITGNHLVKAVVFDGVRAKESNLRSSYDEIRVGMKNINQINCSPILKWNTAELFIYLLHYGILFNDAYRFGFNRVGCKICPLSSGWRDSLSNHVFAEETAPLLRKIESYTENAGIKKNQQKSYIEQNGWRTRMGGKFLKNAGNRFVEKIIDDKISFGFKDKTQNWLDVCKILGSVVHNSEGVYTQIIDGQQFQFTVKNKSVTYRPYSKMDRFIIGHLRAVANKVAYCVGCKACEVQCPVDAFKIIDGKKIYIREENCIHCCNCIEFTDGKGCLISKSLWVTQGGNTTLKGMDRYKTFGFRKSWLEHFFEYRENCFVMDKLGNRQYDALKMWLRESGLLTPAGKGEKSGVPTPLFERLKTFSADNPLTWAVIWTNLAYNSVIVKWYVLNVSVGETCDKSTLVFRLGDDYSESTRDNAVNALFETFRHSPIGNALKQGIPIKSGKIYKFSKQGWNVPEAVAVLYALYVWAEATGRYSFTLSQMHSAKNPNPASIFGITPNNFKDILQDIALQFDKHIRTTFVADLDNVQLFREYKSLDILELASK